MDFLDKLNPQQRKAVTAGNGPVSALAGILGHATSHHFDIPLIVVTGIAVLIGGNLGARVSMKVKTKMIKAGLGLIM